MDVAMICPLKVCICLWTLHIMCAQSHLAINVDGGVVTCLCRQMALLSAVPGCPCLKPFLISIAINLLWLVTALMQNRVSLHLCK